MKRTLGALFLVWILQPAMATDARAQRAGFDIPSTRRVAMGGAGVALSDHDNAVFTNPALLATLERTRVRVLDVQAVVNQNTFTQYDFYDEHRDEFAALGGMSDAEKNRFYQEMLEVARDETVFGFSGMAPLSLVRPGFSFGLFEKARVDYDLREGASAIPLVEADGVAEAEVVIGLGSKITSFFGKPLCFGANAKYLYRAVTRETRTAPAVETIDWVRVYRGWTIAFDVGVLVALENWSVGAGVYDVNWPGIHWRANDDPPDGVNGPEGTIPGSMRVGVGWTPVFGRAGLLDQFKFAFDLESPFSQEMGFFNKVCFGAEARFGGAMKIRAGIHQGYPTAGAGLSFNIFKVEYAFGGEELGRYPGQMASWNHYVSVGLGWGL